MLGSLRFRLPALFLLGHAVFKALVWRAVSWPRVAGVLVLALGSLVAPHVPGLALAAGVLAVLVAVAAADRHLHPVEVSAAPDGGDRRPERVEDVHG